MQYLQSPLRVNDVTAFNGVESYFPHVIIKFYLLVGHLQKKQNYRI